MKTGDTLPEIAERRGDFEDWIGAGVAPESTRVVDVARDEALPEPSLCGAVIITGSSAMVSEREPWSEHTAAWLRDVVAAERPVLGICYGHQLLAHALGGRVGPNPHGREIGTVDVTFRSISDPLLDALPIRARLQTTHVESVLELPPNARLLAWSRLDANHAFRIGRTAWGVQFHPEFDADIMRCYLRARRDALSAEGLDPEIILAACGDSPHGRALLERFVQLATSSAGTSLPAEEVES